MKGYERREPLYPLSLPSLDRSLYGCLDSRLSMRLPLLFFFSLYDLTVDLRVNLSRTQSKACNKNVMNNNRCGNLN